MEMFFAPAARDFCAIHAASRCPETGAFRFVFDVTGAELAADLTVCWLEDKGRAFLRLITVDRVHGADRATARAIEAWVAANEAAVWALAMEAC